MNLSFLKGERLYLRALVDSDAEGSYATWFNDEDICRGNSHHRFPYSSTAAMEYIRHTRQTRESLILAIVLHDGDRHIGNIALQQIHPIYHSAEFSILIGEKDAWGKGYGLEAGQMLCHHGFSALNLHRIACGTFAENTAMEKLALQLGMTKEGVRRQAAFKNGRFVDVIEYGVLKAEFESRNH